MDVSAVDFDGWTPLHAAAHWGQAEACRILAEKLCNMEVRSNAVRSQLLTVAILLNTFQLPSMFSRHFSVRPEDVLTATLHLAQGQTPFDVADESVEDLLEELKQKQTNVSITSPYYLLAQRWWIDTSMSLCLLSLVQWRNEQSILDRQSQQGTTATNAQGKRRRLVSLRIHFPLFISNFATI